MKANWWSRSVPCAVALWGTCAFGQYYVTTAAGGIATNVTATSVSIGPVSSVAVDTAGNLYFPSGCTVVEVNPRTHVLTVVAGNGIPGFGGDGGPATAAQLYQPSAVTVDSAGNLYIADSYRIREVSGGIITTIAGNGTMGTTGDNGPAVSAEVNPLSLAADSAGNLYIGNKVANVVSGVIPGGAIFTETDSIREISHGVITTIAGNGACCHAMGDGVAATGTPLYALGEIAVDGNGNLYAATGAYANSDGVNVTGAIRKIANGVMSTITAPSLSSITGVAVDSAGNVYYSDPGDPSGNGVYEFSNGKTTTLFGSLGQSQALAVDGSGNLYIADAQNAVIRQFANGSAPAVAGNGHISFSGDGGPATIAQFDFPGGLAFDAAGNLYVADQDNGRIREIAGGIITTVAGSSTLGFSGDGGLATAAGLYNPRDVAFDSAGDMYIADTVNQCVRMVEKGIVTTIAGRGSGANGYGDGGPATAAYFDSVNSVAVDAAGNVYVSDGVANRVRKISNGIITTVAGNGTRGFSGDGGPATLAELFGPGTIRVDAAGNLYIVDSNNYRIREVIDGVIYTIAGNGSQTTSGDGRPATSAGIFPGGMAFDSAGHLFVSDYGSIREIIGGVIRTIAGTGTPGASADNLPALTAAIDPGALLVNAVGDVFFSESDGRVRVLTQPTICAGYLVETKLEIGNAGGPLNLTIRDGANCLWTVPGLPSWITTSATGGSGPGSITVTVAPNNGSARSASFVVANSAFTIAQEPQLVVTTPSPLPVGTTGAAYSQSLTAAGGLPPYTWSVANGALPVGLTLASAGAISGTPSAAGIYQFTMLATDSASAIANATYSLTVITPGGTTPPGSIVTSTVPGGSFLDSSGNVYSAGVYSVYNSSVPPPVSPGAAQGQSNGGMSCGAPEQQLVCPNAYFSKYDPQGNLLVGFFLGGAYSSQGTAITADSAGNIYVVGRGDFVPVTAHAAIGSEPLPGNAFAAKISSDGTRFLYVTYLPAVLAYPAALAVDAAGNLYVGGTTTAAGNPAVVTCVSADGSAILYSKVLASVGGVYAATVDPSGNLLAAGRVGSSDLPVTPGAVQATLPAAAQSGYNAFVAKLDSSGTVLAATYLGGNSWETVSSVASDAAGNIYVAGETSSENFPTTANALWTALPVPLWSTGSRAGYIAKLSPDTTSLLYSTFVMSLGSVFAAAIGSDGEMYLTASAYAGVPVTPSAPQPCFSGGPSAFLAHLSTAGTLLDATYLPDTPIAAMSLASDGAVYVYSSPFLAQVRFGGAGFAAPACVTNLLFNAASQMPGAGVAPGEFVTLAGYGIGPQTGVAYAGQIPTSLGGVQVFFDGVPAPILYAQSQQVNVQAPFTINGITAVTLTYNSTTFGPFSMPVTFADPETFRLHPGVSTQALAFNLDNTLNGPSNPVAPGSYVYFYGTGFGPTSPNCTAGGLNVPVAANLAGVAVTVYDATVAYAGSAPGLPCGVTQINLQVPADAPPGPNFIHLSASSGNNTATPTMTSTIVVK